MATDTFLKNPVLIVGTKQEVSATTIQENDLVVVTDERFYTAEEVDDIVGSAEQSIRNDMNTSDSNLQTQITAQTGEITTIKNGLGDLGDQVSDIEEKIPEDASAQNQLATKNQITELQNSKQDIATAVNYDNITNCITEIPQDIKLGLGGTKQLYAWTTGNDTLYTDTTQAGAYDIKVYNANGQDVTSTKGIIYISSDGTYIWCDVDTISKHYRDTSNDKTIDYNNSVILKAGSTIYIPNGVGVFDKYTYTSDVTLNISAGVTAKLIVFANGTNKSLAAQAENCFYSGANPTISTSIAIWYDTTENKIKFSDNSGSTWISPYAFPIAKITVSNGEITSIDQVFNGFGYIGSTIFALPGVKALIPNGRNPDGSLNNIKTTVSSPKIMTMGNYMAGRNNAPLCLFSNISLGGMDIDANRWGTLKKLRDLPRTANEYSCWHCLEDNFFHYFNVSGVESISQRAFVGSFDVDSNNKITSFTPKTAFYALDKSDTEYIAHQAMPSDRYIDLTLGSSGTSYIAPADGYIILLKKGNYQQYITIDSGYDKVYADYAYNDQVVCLRISVKKGRNYSVWYSASQETQRFAFIYANGSK